MFHAKIKSSASKSVGHTKFKPGKLIFAIVAIAMFLSSCGEKKESLTELKAKEADLKSQLSEVSSRINKLEGDSGKKFALVEVDKLKPGIFKSYINVQGRVDAEESVSLSSEMPGTIAKINVRPGDVVTKGQVLAETDSRAIQQQLAAMQTSLNLVNQMYEKQKNLWDQKIGTEVQFLQVKAMKEATESAVNAMQEQVRMSKIISPIDGTVDAVDIKLGQLTAPGMPAIRVINFSRLKIKADLAESYALRVKKGDEVKVKFPDFEDTLTTKVAYAARSISPLSRTFGVEIVLDNKKEYHPNQIAILNINDYRSEKPVISTEIKYIQKDLKGERFVMVADNNKAVKRYVATGREYGGRVEIKGGLRENDELITSGFERLNEGDAIKIKI
jgi:membrane fusion protein, multidrug efflux system